MRDCAVLLALAGCVSVGCSTGRPEPIPMTEAPLSRSGSASIETERPESPVGQSRRVPVDRRAMHSSEEAQDLFLPDPTAQSGKEGLVELHQDCLDLITAGSPLPFGRVVVLIESGKLGTVLELLDRAHDYERFLFMLGERSQRLSGRFAEFAAFVREYEPSYFEPFERGRLKELGLQQAMSEVFSFDSSTSAGRQSLVEAMCDPGRDVISRTFAARNLANTPADGELVELAIRAYPRILDNHSVRTCLMMPMIRRISTSQPIREGLKGWIVNQDEHFHEVLEFVRNTRGERSRVFFQEILDGNPELPARVVEWIQAMLESLDDLDG